MNNDWVKYNSFSNYFYCIIEALGNYLNYFPAYDAFGTIWGPKASLDGKWFIEKNLKENIQTLIDLNTFIISKLLVFWIKRLKNVNNNQKSRIKSLIYGI